VLQDDD